jgi:hypothetical protein
MGQKDREPGTVRISLSEAGRALLREQVQKETEMILPVAGSHLNVFARRLSLVFDWVIEYWGLTWVLCGTITSSWTRRNCLEQEKCKSLF